MASFVHPLFVAKQAGHSGSQKEFPAAAGEGVNERSDHEIKEPEMQHLNRNNDPGEAKMLL